MTYDPKDYSFWECSGHAYAALSLLSDPDDWENIVSSAASEAIEGLEGRQRLRILDIGTGSGETAFRIAQRLSATHRFHADFTLVEPSPRARSSARLRFLPASHLGGAPIYASVDEICPGSRFDVITFIHSTYYIDDLLSELDILSKYMAEGSKFVFLVLPEGSPYFLSLGKLGHLNLAEEVIKCCQKLGFKISVDRLKSRLNVPVGLWSNKDWLRLISQMYPAQDKLSQIEEKIPEIWLDGVDFGDWLISARL